MFSKSFSASFDAFADRITYLAGSSGIFFAVLGLVLLWVISGPLFHFSDTWQLIMNTISSIVTFLMVFLIQRAQNKDAMAIHLKLNELISATDQASDYLIAVESFTQEELEVIQKYYEKLVAVTKDKANLKKIYSEKEAIERVNRKFKGG
jgi:low affinity Fe/Cu permease